MKNYRKEIIMKEIIKKFRLVLPIFLFGILFSIPTMKTKALRSDTFWFEWINPKIYVSISQFEAESNELMTLVNNHYKKPSFDGKTINMPIKDKLTLTDTNGVLDKYKVSLSGNATYKVSGNTLTIYPTNEVK